MEQRKRIDEDSVEKGESSSMKLTTESLEQMQSVNSVFNNPLLMDKIVNYTIYSSNGKKLSKQEILTIRLVNKSFLQSASRTLKKSGDWMFRLEIGGPFGAMTVNKEILNKTKGIILDTFVSVFSKTSASMDSILPIQFEIEQYYLTEENSKNLTNLFEHCGHTISTLRVKYPLDGGSLNLKCNDLSLPILQTLKFSFENWKDGPHTNQDKAPVSQNHTNGLAFLQEILQNSKNLQHFIYRNYDASTINTSCIRLPTTIQKLELCSPLPKNELTLLTNNQLPKLNTLEWKIGRFEEEPLIHKILERFGKQLTKLVMHFMPGFNEDDEEEEERRFCIKFPLMEKLKYLKVSGEDFDLSPELRRDVWPKLVPNLTQLIIEELTEPMFFDWVQGSQFENVEKLEISISYYEQHCQCTVSPKVQIVQEIITSFPNIQKLSLGFSLDETSGLKYLFQNLTCLKKLDLGFDFDGLEHETLGYKLVSLFLGISLEQATVIVDDTTENVAIEVDNSSSIMNLTELNSLTLCSPDVHSQINKFFHCLQLISRFGLSKMPKLVKTKFLGGFKPRELYSLTGRYYHRYNHSNEDLCF